MPLIHSDGLFDGDRINACSPMAQLYYPRLMCAANGYGRMNISYLQIVSKAFPRWPSPEVPSEETIMGFIHEYHSNRLIYLYRCNGQLWGQWDAKSGTFGKYQTTEDKRSPAPPEEDFNKWINENRNLSSKTSEPCGNIAEILRKGSENLPHGVGVGVGKRVACDVLGKGVKPSAQKRRGPKSPDQVTPFDSRHVRIKSLICNAYEQQNQAECPWDGGEGKQLKALLSATPGWVDSQIAQCLVNMYDSGGFAKGTRPREFLPRLPRYLNGPLNEFNREQSNVGTRSVSKADAREQRIVERAIAYRTVTAGAANSAGNGQMAVPGNGSTGVCGLDGEPEILPPGKDSGSVRPPDVRAAKT